MGIIEIILIGLALGMDAFAVAICKGLSMKKMNWVKAIIVGLYFGLFQAIMPTIGYFLGKSFESIIINIDHWVAFVLLSLIGINMIREALRGDVEETNDKVDVRTMIPLAIATSVDALAMGVTFSLLYVNIILSVVTIGVISFILCIMGVKIGNIFGSKYKKGAEMFGGVILILMGLKILVEHLLY